MSGKIGWLMKVSIRELLISQKQEFEDRKDLLYKAMSNFK